MLYNHCKSNLIHAKGQTDICLYIAVIATLVSAAYWSLVSVQLYYNFKTSFDLAQIESSMYYAIHYPSVVGGLQYIVFATHVAVDQFLVLPLFYLYPYGITLLILQAAILSFTGLLVFLIARDLKLGSIVSLALCIAYLLNPGMHGMILHDYHAEFLIIPFTLMIFYFYMKTMWKPFVISLFLLLLTLDDVVFTVFFLGAGLLYYEFAYTKDEKLRKEKLKLAATIMIASIIAYSAYAAISSSLTFSYYNSTRYVSMPQYLRLLPFSFYLPTNVTSTSAARIPSANSNPQLICAAIAAILIGVFAFGIAVIADPMMTFLFVVPWLFGMFFSYEGRLFTNPNLHYFSYVIGSAIVAAMLGIKILHERKSRFRIFRNADLARLDRHIIYSMFFVTLAVLLLSLYEINSAKISLTPFANSTTMEHFYAVTGMASMIPPNGSLLTQGSIFPQVYQLPRVELLSSYYYFQPQYILIDTQTITISEYKFFKNLTSNYDYSLVAENDTIRLYVESKS